MTKLIAVLDSEIIFGLLLLQCSRIRVILSNVAGEEFMKGSVDKYYCVIDYAEGNVQDKKSRGTDTLAPLLRQIGHL